ncbi:bifunctional tetrahydrofolate synthase/dihydrofolate synthase [Fontimonas sp. SYSU GA230001]|uniref:bifunctional tetrahydrofolate synthase/dihydrofolate synthase n=1 Tax=Fontimonas sp. SYSU GA230001 TaxID=3142450 RepID=UPI0032B34FE3
MTRTLDEWLRWQETLHPRAIELGLQRVAEVAARLRLLERSPPTLVVGGTNGKGSSAHLAALIYREAGYRVGLYTSPHLRRYNERVRVDDRCADDAELCGAFAAVEAARGSTPLTYFEFGTLAALWLFRESAVEARVLEVGLGGRLDAVNIVDADAALVTSIGLDHLDWLGPDRESIAREKAGIFRPGRPAVVAEPDPPRSLIDTACALGADLRVAGRDFGHDATAGGFDWHGRAWRLGGLPSPGLPGAVQVQNASGVLACIEALAPSLPVEEAAIRRALPALRVAGRCEQRGRYLLDVAHNREAAEVLGAHLDTLERGTPRVLVLGMLADKPHAAVARVLAPRVDHWVLVDTPGERGLAATELARRIGTDAGVRCCDNMRDALSAARALAGPRGRIVVTGSFLTVAAAAAELDG